MTSSDNTSVNRSNFFSLLLVLLLSFVLASSWLRAEDETNFSSPDGKFAMLLKEKEENVLIELIEVGTHKSVLELADTGYNNSRECKLLWSADSQRVAFFEKGGHFGATTVYFRNESGFEAVPLPELPSCHGSAKKDEDKTSKQTGGMESPERWLRSGALVIAVETSWVTMGGDVRECQETVTIAFDKKHKALIQNVTRKRK